MIGNGYSCAWGVISRSGGGKKASSAIGKTAYDCRLDLTDEATGERFNYTKRAECLAYGTSMPAHAPKAWRDKPDVLAEAMKKAESRKNAQEGWMVRHTLPRGLTDKENIFLTKNISRKITADLGLAGTWAIHPDRKSDNPHAHHVISTREATPDGFGKKRRDLKDKAHLAKVREIVALQCAAMLERAASSRKDPQEKSALKLSAERWRHGHKTLPEQAAAARRRGDWEFAEHCQERDRAVRLDVQGAEERRGKNAVRDQAYREKKIGQLKPTDAETEKAKRYDIDLTSLSGAVAEAFGKATTHQEFRDNLEATGYQLALNEWKAKDGTTGKSLSVVGKKGDVWSLYRTIGRSNPNISNKQLNAIIDRDKLPTVARVLFWKRAVAKSGKAIGRALAGLGSARSVAASRIEVAAAFVKEQTAAKPQQQAKDRPSVAVRVPATRNEASRDYTPPKRDAAPLPSRAQQAYNAAEGALLVAIEEAENNQSKTPEDRAAEVAALRFRLSTEPRAAMQKILEEEQQTEEAAARAEEAKRGGVPARKDYKKILGTALVAAFLLPSIGADSQDASFVFALASVVLTFVLGLGIAALIVSAFSFRNKPGLQAVLTFAAVMVCLTTGTELYNLPQDAYVYDDAECLAKPKWYQTVTTDDKGNKMCSVIYVRTTIDKLPPPLMCSLDVFKDSAMCRNKQNQGVLR